MTVSMILAVSENGVIGLENKLPWKKLPGDLQYFKKTTSGHTVIMGRKTYESLGKALPNRRNVVITRNEDWASDDAEVMHSLEDARKACEGEDEIFIIGGSTIYEMALEQDLIDKIHLTRIHAGFQGDTFFEMPEDEKWQVESADLHKEDDWNPYDFTIYVYVKNQEEGADTEQK